MKKNLWVLAAIVAVMVGCPWAAVTFASGDTAMAICFVLFFGLNCVCSLYVGIFSGMAVRQRFWLPMVNAAVFLLGAWTVFEWGNPDFYGYAVTYLVIGLLTMVVTI